MVKTCFRGNYFTTIKHFRPNHFWWKFFVQTCFRGNDFANFFMKLFCSNLFSRKRFCNHKNFGQKFFMKIFVQTCFLGNDFATINNFRPKNFLWKFLVQTCFLGNDIATIKNFRPKNLYDNLWFKPVFEELNLQP